MKVHVYTVKVIIDPRMTLDSLTNVHCLHIVYLEVRINLTLY